MHAWVTMNQIVKYNQQRSNLMLRKPLDSIPIAEEMNSKSFEIIYGKVTIVKTMTG